MSLNHNRRRRYCLSSVFESSQMRSWQCFKRVMKGQNGPRIEGSQVVSGRAGADDGRGYSLTGSFFPFTLLFVGPVFSCVVLIFISLLLFLNHRPFGRWRSYLHPLGILQAWRRLYSTAAVRSLIFGSPVSTAINTVSVIDLFRYPAG